MALNLILSTVLPKLQAFYHVATQRFQMYFMQTGSATERVDERIRRNLLR